MLRHGRLRPAVSDQRVDYGSRLRMSNPLLQFRLNPVDHLVVIRMSVKKVVWITLGYVLACALLPREIWIGATLVAVLGLLIWALTRWVSRQEIQSEFGAAASAVALARNARHARNLFVGLGLDRTTDVVGPLGAIERVQRVPQVIGSRPTPSGAVLQVRGVIGHDLNTWVAASPRLATAFGVPTVVVSEPTPNLFELALRTHDPLAEPLVEDFLEPPQDPTLGDPRHQRRRRMGTITVHRQ